MIHKAFYAVIVILFLVSGFYYTSKESSVVSAASYDPALDNYAKKILDNWRADGAFIQWFGTSLDPFFYDPTTGAPSAFYDLADAVEGFQLVTLDTDALYCAFPGRHYTVNGDFGSVQYLQSELAINRNLRDYYMLVERIGDPVPSFIPKSSAPSVIAFIVDRRPLNRAEGIACSPAVLRTLGVRASRFGAFDPFVGGQVRARLIPKTDSNRSLFAQQGPIIVPGTVPF